MAKVLSKFEYKNVGATAPGELIVMAVKGKAAYCININTDQPNDGYLRLGILKWEEADYPIWFNADQSSPCLSFGKDWVVDYDFGEESIPRRDGTSGDRQVLLISHDQALLRFDPPAKGGSEIDSVLIDISAGGRVDYAASQKAVPFMRWRIWASEADILDTGKQPLIKFG